MEVEATPGHQTQTSRAVSSVPRHGSAPIQAVSHTPRPKAADLHKTVNTPAEVATRNPVLIPAAPKLPDSQHPPPKTPQIPWDLYGLTEEWAESQTGDMAATYHPARQQAPQLTPGTSPQNRFSSWPSGSGHSELVLVAESASPPTRKRPRTKRRTTQADPHDKVMSEDYIPLSTSSPHRNPERASQKPHPRRLPVAVTSSKPPEIPKAEEADIFPRPLPEEPTSDPTPSPTVSEPLSLKEEEEETTREAHLEIWNLGSNPTPRHAIRHTPARPGTVCCETCFRDELARWTRMRDGVVGVLKLLGGEAALREVRVLMEEVEDCHRDRGESKDWGVPHLNEYPADVVGLVLLRVMVERPTSGLTPRQRDEAERLLEALRRDVGVGLKSFDALTTVCKARLVCWRLEGQEQPSGEDRWWWEFDDSLQAANHLLSRARHPPSLFVSALSRKAFDTAVAALSAREIITTQARCNTPTSHQTATTTFTQLERTLGLPTPSNLFLRTTGDKLALARRQTLARLTSSAQPFFSSTTAAAGATSSINNANHNTKKRPHPSSPSTSPPPSKRPKPATTTQAHNNTHAHPARADILPCIHCSHSAASHRHLLRTTTAHPTRLNHTAPKPKQDWLRSLKHEPEREMQVVDLLPPPGHGERGSVVRVMVDGTGGGMRIVVVEMRGIFEVVFGGADGRFGRFVIGAGHHDWEGGGRVLGVARPVGRWERWRGGKLEGWREV